MNQINKNSIKLSLLIILLISLTLGGTYAFLNYSANSDTAQGTGGCFQVNYSGTVISDLGNNIVQSNETGAATDLATGSLPNANSTVTLSKTSSCKIYTEAKIYIHTNEETTAPIEGVQAFKYKITQGSNTIETGVINKKGDFLLTTVPITDSALTYNIYLWIDSAISGGAYNSTTFSGKIFAESSQTSTIENTHMLSFSATGSDKLPDRVVTLNQNYGTLPTPSKTGYTFQGWNGKNKFDKNKLTKTNDSNISTTATGFTYTRTSTSSNNLFVASADLNLKADTTYTFIINIQNGSISPYVYTDNLWGNLLVYGCTRNGNYCYNTFTTDSTGHTVLGFYSVSQSQGSTGEISNIMVVEGNIPYAEMTTYEPYLVTSTTPVTQNKNHTLTAIWSPVPYTVTLAPNGGNVTPTTMSVNYGEKYGTLPTPYKSGYTFKGWSELPADYQQLDYIESTGTQYINTGVQLFSGTNHEIIIDFTPTAFYNYNSLWGTTVDADTFEGWIYSNGQLASRFKSVRYGADNTIVLNNRYYYDLKKEGTILSKYLNGQLIGNGTVTAALTSAQQAANFLLLLSGSDYGKYKIQSTKLYRDNTLMRDMIPCYKISTGKAGMYDVANNVFYPNSATSGADFTRGDNKYITKDSAVTQAKNHTLTAIWEAN